jgi:HK97 family phage prohead protease
MEFKASATAIKGIDGRTVTGIASTFGVLDMYNDIVNRGAYKKTIKERPGKIRHLWMHNFREPPIATINKLSEVGRDALPEQIKADYPEATGGLEITRTYLDTPRGNEILQGLLSDPPAINEMSIGFDPIKWEVEENEDEGKFIRYLQEIRLWDTSDVTWGANPATIGKKEVIPYRDYGTTDEDTEWSAPTLNDFTNEQFDDLSKSEKTRIYNHYAFSVNRPPENFGDLKLPHHRPGESGVGPAIWRGVTAAMAALMGARGGVDMPDSDRKGVYNHLAKHYDQYGEEPPEFKFVQMSYSAYRFYNQYHELEKGNNLPSNWRDIAETLEAMFDQLKAEPKPDSTPDSLTFDFERMRLRLEVAQRRYI